MNQQLSIPISEGFNTNNFLISLTHRISERITQNFIKISNRCEKNGMDNFNLHSLNSLIRKIPKKAESTLIASIDSSCIPIASSNKGVAIATRATIVFFKDKKTHGYLKIGPLMLYINESNIQDLLSLNENKLYSNISNDIEIIQRLIRIKLERFIQFELARSLSKALILIDGSLKPSIFEDNEINLAKIIETSLSNNNTCIGICKSSKIIIFNKFAEILNLSKGAPFYLDVSNLTNNFVKGLAGRIFLTKFMDDGIPLRVDIVQSELQICEEILSKVYSNDLFCRGYPESLRLAHHFSVFSETEYVGMCSYVLKDFGISGYENHRQTLLSHLSFARHVAR